MKRGLALAIIFTSLTLVFLNLTTIQAITTDSIEFNQIGDKLVIKENNNGNQTSLVTQEGLDKTSGGYYFIKKIEANNNYDTLLVSLNLEKGVTVKSNEIFPTNYMVTTNGEIITITWNYSNVKKGEVFAFFVTLNNPNKVINLNWLIYLIAIIFLLTGSFFIYKYLKNKKQNLDKHLLDEERKVIQLLKKADRNELWQKNIQITLNLSKAKLSRLIRNLESRNLIEKIPFGNTNKIILK